MQHKVQILRHRQRKAEQRTAPATDILDTMPGLREEVARINGEQALQRAIRICAGRDPHGLG
ncbi:hypothetical protein HC341_02025 [Aquisalimonas sp. 2447]|uniref:hypothetical protein n=1 Tax=Aquisalimonas sp. 2447 TaxID=2740807 RepID=UPI0014325E93|nr:hypothetical protein [Aquisalimonas sp. 2447]QIT54098.1 hypothetical protein HC341_02025 [Aquisalimonas sp. 2447]